MATWAVPIMVWSPASAVKTWWWWRPVVWTSWAIVWGATQPPPPVVYDYGTDIIIKKEIVYVDGKETVPAVEYRQQAIKLANPATPPPPPVPQSDNDTSLIPLGVWALVQEDKGDAIMFYQLTATKDGLITGAYSNALTGESAPVTGSIDKETQRVAFHTGEKGETVIECNMNGLTKEQTGAFVHFGTGQTQEWLLVKMPNPDMPDTATPINTTPAPSSPK